ncbi:MAG: hypothetical protein WCK67_09865 [bacterium]
MQLTTRTTANYPTYQKKTAKQQVAFSGNIGTKIVDKCWENHDKAYNALGRQYNKAWDRHALICDEIVVKNIAKTIEKKCPAFYKFANSKPGFVVRMIAEGIVGGIIGGTLFNKFY